MSEFSFESADGTKVSESGNQKQVGPKPEDIGTVSKGSYSFTTPDGVVLTVNWVADENGFQATGDHLPTPPPPHNFGSQNPRFWKGLGRLNLVRI